MPFFNYDYRLAVWLIVYTFSTESYNRNLGHLQTFSYKVYTKISDKRWVKSQKTALVGGREGHFMSYTNKSIYQVYFPNSRRIEIVWDLEFDENYDYKEMRTTAIEEPLFSFLH